MEDFIIKDINDNSQNFRELSIITKISQTILKTLDYEEILQTISNGISELLEIGKAAIYILEDETQLYLRAATPPIDPELPDIFRRANLHDHPHVETALSTQKPLFISDTQTEILSPAEENIIKLSNARSLLYLPFIKGKKAIGVLILIATGESKNYSERQIELGQTVANQLSVAIQNAQLHNDIIKHNENLEQLVAERTEELQAIIEELSNKNEIVIQQKKDIELVLKNLKATQAQLIQSEKMASIGVLTSGVAHEINNPLNYIMGGYIGLYNELQTFECGKDKRISVFLNGIKMGIDRAAEIVKGLNQLSRDNDNYNEECEIDKILDNCLTILHYKYRNRIEIIKDYRDEKMCVKGNTGKLHQAFLNILSNAIDAIEHDGTIFIDTFYRDTMFVVSIKDSGCGISPANLKKILDPFFTTKDPGKGTGLGLSITNTIIQQHNGQLHFESEPDKGTTVLIHLPKTHSNE